MSTQNEKKPQLILSIDTSTSVPTLQTPQSMNTATISRAAPGRKVEANTASAASGGSGSPAPMSKEEQSFVDEFGFCIRDESQVMEELRYVKGIDGEVVKRREMKWETMAKDWSRTNETMWDKMKSRCRKGIPTRMRGIVWQLLVGAHMKISEHKGVFQMLLKKTPDSETAGLIERDLHRTFPTHKLFEESDGIGQQSMRNVLHAYCAVDPEVGYVQGQGFIVATLLTQMKEEEAFWTFHEMMQANLFAMREIFRPQFPMLQLCFFQLKKLMNITVPSLLAHFDSIGLDVSIFASQWFMTLFAYHFPFRGVLRLWDCFLCEGWKIVFRVALYLLKLEEPNMLGQQIDVCMKIVRTISDGKNPDTIIDNANKSIKFKTEQLLQFRNEYEAELRKQAAQQEALMVQKAKQQQQQLMASAATNASSS